MTRATYSRGVDEASAGYHGVKSYGFKRNKRELLGVVVKPLRDLCEIKLKLRI